MIVGQANTLTFSLVAPSGVTYSSPVVTIEENPWATSSAITDNGNGTYSITITPDRETKRVVKLKVIDQGTTRYHALVTVATADDVTLANTTYNNVGIGGTLTFTTQVQDSVGIKNWYMGTGGVIVPGSFYARPDTNGVTIVNVTGTSSTDVTSVKMTASQTWTTAYQYRMTWGFDVVHPLSGVVHSVSYVSDHYRAITPAWISTGTVTAGIENVLQFSLKFADGSGVKGVKLAPITVAGVTINPNIVVIDETAGIYGVKVTPGFANFSINPQFSIGVNTVVQSVGSKTFTSVAGATVTMAAPAGATRTIGIKLLGATSGDVITAVSGGAIMDPAVGGPWTPTANGVFFIPLPASNRNRPANTNTTPNTADTINVTFTRGGQTVTVPCQITVVWANVKVAAFSMTNNAVQFSSTINGTDAGWTYSAANIISETGTALATSGTVTNNFATDGKVYWNLSAKLAAQKYVSFSGSANNGFNSTFWYWTDPFEITRNPYLVMKPPSWDFGLDHAVAGTPVDLADMAVTFTDDLGAPVSGVSFNTIPGVDKVSGFRGVWQPRLADGTDWSKALVPVTDGSDGKYILKLSSTGFGFANWWVSVFSSTIVFNTSIGLQTLVVSARIN